MSSATSLDDILTHQYTSLIDTLCETARVYYTLGRLADAQYLLRTSLQVRDIREAMPQHRLKVLLLYGQVLVVDHFLRRGQDPETVFSTLQHAKQIAEATHHRQGIADAISLRGQAHYFASVVSHRRNGVPIASSPGDSKYDEALAYQQEALELRQVLQDMRGVSESFFLIGVVYERWRQYERAQEYYIEARQIADQYAYPFEKTEPTRHLAFHAFREGKVDEALSLALEALALRQAAPFRPYLPFDHLLVRQISLAKGDMAHAEFHTQQAQTLAEEMGLQTLVSSLLATQPVLPVYQQVDASYDET